MSKETTRVSRHDCPIRIFSHFDYVHLYSYSTDIILPSYRMGDVIHIHVKNSYLFVFDKIVPYIVGRFSEL
jgi:sugar phosphate isomerase/epimerase